MSARVNIDIRVPLADGPGFIEGAFYERQGSGDIEIGLVKKSGYAYGFSRLTPAEFWRIVDTLFPEGRPADANDPLRRSGD